MSLFSNIRFYVIVFAFFLSVVEYILGGRGGTTEARKSVILVPLFAYTAVTFLYFALLAGPLTKIFQWLPFRAQYLKARRAIGVSAFYFALIHAKFAFFDFLGGLAGLTSLNSTFIIAIVLADIALIILSFMAATSFDYMVKILTFPKWKMLHRFVYIAAFFILIHAILIGERLQEFLLIRVLLGAGTISLVALHITGLLIKYKKI